MSTRPLGIPLPGKGFASFVVGAVTAAVVVLGWPAGAAIAVAGLLVGDLGIRRLPLRTVVTLAGHLSTACVIGGLLYSASGGVLGPGALSISNLWPLVLILVSIPLIANATFYLQLRASPAIPWVDPSLTLRWELAVSAVATALTLGLLAILSPALPAAETAVLAAAWFGFATLGHWLIRRGVEGESLMLVQRLTRAIGARTEFVQAFDDMKRLTTSLVPWHEMGIAAYRPEAQAFEVLLETDPEIPPGTRFPAHDGLAGVAFTRGEPVTDGALDAESRDEHGVDGSEILVPLKHGGRLIGLWSVRHREPRAYRPDEARLLGHLAPQLALSIALDSLVRPVLDASEQTVRQTQAITHSTQELRARSQESATKAGAVATIVQQLAEALGRGATQAESARELAEESASRGDATRRSGQEMLQTVRSVREATTTALEQLTAAAAVVDEGASEMARLHEVSETVERFRETIVQLADQSGLLALNASIEAARAGEHGRGFGVVAQEIRVLADRSAREAEGIAEGVQYIRETLERAVDLMERTRAEVISVTSAGDRWSRDLDTIVAAAEAVAETGRNIADAAREAAAGSKQMAALLERSAAEAEEGAEATQGVAKASAEQKRLTDELDRAAGELARMAERLAFAATTARAEGRGT